MQYICNNHKIEKLQYICNNYEMKYMHNIFLIKMKCHTFAEEFAI